MIAELLRLYLAVNHIGVREFAKTVDISPATVSRITRGEQIDAATMLKMIRWLFEVRK